MNSDQILRIHVADKFIDQLSWCYDIVICHAVCYNTPLHPFIQHKYFEMQHNYVTSMRDDSVNMRLMMHVSIITLYIST